MNDYVRKNPWCRRLSSGRSATESVALILAENFEHRYSSEVTVRNQHHPIVKVLLPESIAVDILRKYSDC